MAITAEQYQKIILDECNVSDDITVMENLPVWWEMYSDKATTALIYWYVRRHVLEYLMGKLRKHIDTTIGPDTLKSSQLFANAEKMYKLADARIKEMEESGETSAGVGSFKTTRGKRVWLSS